MFHILAQPGPAEPPPAPEPPQPAIDATYKPEDDYLWRLSDVGRTLLLSHTADHRFNLTEYDVHTFLDASPLENTPATAAEEPPSSRPLHPGAGIPVPRMPRQPPPPPAPPEPEPSPLPPGQHALHAGSVGLGLLSPPVAASKAHTQQAKRRVGGMTQPAPFTFVGKEVRKTTMQRRAEDDARQKQAMENEQRRKRFVANEFVDRYSGPPAASAAAAPPASPRSRARRERSVRRRRQRLVQVAQVEQVRHSATCEWGSLAGRGVGALPLTGPLGGGAGMQGWRAGTRLGGVRHGRGGLSGCSADAEE